MYPLPANAMHCANGGIRQAGVVKIGVNNVFTSVHVGMVSAGCPIVNRVIDENAGKKKDWGASRPPLCSNLDVGSPFTKSYSEHW